MFPKRFVDLPGEVLNVRHSISMSKASKSSEGKISVLCSELDD